ncbi:YkgJ family cysteine cluster protein [Flavobacterium sp. N1994]|uniref:YkgJ family cysteine cluster protein n=1 Tax=Flavobacterium sp. N1994 TaxID=2986827 RepID=UPI0022227542|nr:YkgJ family cysteine cluster protein [Flavobacterium sp. N1994]
MAIETKVKLVEQLFDRLEKEISQFQSQTGLHCIAGCGRCCTTPHIDASPLEFFPWAFHLYLNGQAERMLDELNDSNQSLCHIYRPLSIVDSDNGSCSNYKYRGLICRLFGYAASRDQFGKLRLATCKIIKENQPDNYQNTTEAISKGLYIPIFSDYYMHLSQIDFKLAKTMLPVNEALKRAIEEVLHYYAYHPFPTDLKTPA